VLSLYDSVSHYFLAKHAVVHPQVASRIYLGNVCFCLGLPDQALARGNEAVAEAEKLDHPPSLAVTLAFGVILLSLVGDMAALDNWSGRLVAVTTEQGFPVWRAMGTIYSGWVDVKNGNVAEGISLLRSGLAAYRATGAEVGMPLFSALLAKAYEASEKFEEAVTLLDDVLSFVDRTRGSLLEAELNRHKGQLLLRQGHAEAAEELYRKALAIAQEQDAKMWELRAAVSLARLWRDQGKRAKARDLLAPVYAWFTEGFDTRDLLAAKALLDEL
jgi:predicted ATPase